MLDPIVQFFSMLLHKLGLAIGWVLAALLWPFSAFAAWVRKRGFVIKGLVSLAVIGVVLSYGYLFYKTQIWHGFDPQYSAKYDFTKRNASAGSSMEGTGEAGAKTCTPSAIVTVTRDLIDMNVNQNSWVPSMLLSKLGFFGMGWKYTPYFDNKAAFQLGVQNAVQRTSSELMDTLGRVRGTSQLDQNLQIARQNAYYPEALWYLDGFKPTRPTQAKYRESIPALDAFNDRLKGCDATFDPRADNLITFLDRISKDIGSTSDILRERAEAYNSGWFDTRADDRFWFTYGQLYAYSGIMAAARADFSDVVKTRQLDALWDRAQLQFEQALQVQPFVISNGNEGGWIMPTHLATAGFYILRVRSNLVEIRDTLAR